MSATVYTRFPLHLSVPGAERRGGWINLFSLKSERTDQKESTNYFNSPHHAGGVSFIWRNFSSPKRDPTSSEIGLSLYRRCRARHVNVK